LPSETLEEVCEAIEIRYRQIDLAWKYDVSPRLAMTLQISTSRVLYPKEYADLDDTLRLALQTPTVPREELFVVTKFQPQFARDPALCLEQSRKTGLIFVDLYLMHWPVAFAATTNLADAIPDSDEPAETGTQWLDFAAQKPVTD
jgi:diketogulonate reductase-like aldo/keto reductase